MNSTAHKIISRLKNVTGNERKGWHACCPNPDHGKRRGDRNPLLHIDKKSNGNVLLHCFAGCELEAILSAIGLKLKDLYVEASDRNQPDAAQEQQVTNPSDGLTLAQVAEAKKLSQLFLASLGVKDTMLNNRPAILISYCDIDGKEIAHRYRVALSAAVRFVWRKGDSAILYGLQRLKHFNKADPLLVVEGESDTWTAWHHNIQAVGVPGKTIWKHEWKDFLNGFENIVVWQEPNASDFPLRIAEDLPNAKRIIAPADIKDLSEAHVRGRDIPKLFTDLLQNAKPITELSRSAPRFIIKEALEASGLLNIKQYTSTDTDQLNVCFEKLCSLIQGCSQKEFDSYRLAAAHHLKKIGLGAKDTESYVKSRLVFPVADQKRSVGEDPSLTPEDIEKFRQTAKPLLEDPHIIETIKKELAKGYGDDVGYPTLCYVAFTSRLLKMRDGNLPCHIIIRGSSSLGKSYIYKKALQLFPPDAYVIIDAGSQRALIYMGARLQHRVLIYSEIDSLPAGDDNPAASAVRNLATDHYLHYNVVEQDPNTKQHKTREIKIPGPTVLLTTAITLKNDYGQLSTRTFVLDVPPSLERLAKIVIKMGELEQNPSEPPDPSFHALQSYLQTFAPIDVVVPFSVPLSKLISKRINAPRILRDFQRILSFIKSVAILNIERRTKDDQGRYQATIDDYQIVYELLNKVFEETTTKVTEELRKVVGAVEKLTAHELAWVTYGKLASELNLHPEQVKRLVRRGIATGFLINMQAEKNAPAKVTTTNAEPLPARYGGLPTREDIEQFEASLDQSKTHSPSGNTDEWPDKKDLRVELDRMIEPGDCVDASIWLERLDSYASPEEIYQVLSELGIVVKPPTEDIPEVWDRPF